MLHTSDRVVETLARLQRYADTPSVTHQTPPLTIAISRQAGSRGAAIAQAVGARLGWPVYDHELLTRIAEEKGLSARLLDHLDERRRNWLEGILANLSIQSNTLDGLYLKHLIQLLSSLGKAGHCVIVGRGAPHVLPSESTLRIRVVAPRALRVANTEMLKGVTKVEAERWLDKTDADRTAFMNAYFCKDVADPLNYDLILNSGRFNTDECAEMIVQAVRLREGQVTATAAPRNTA